MKATKIEKANIGMVKEHFSAYVTLVEQGTTVQVCRRNRPVAELVPLEEGNIRNRTRLGSDPGSVISKCDLTAPAIPETEWDMLK
jgi:antitoxin (DNA-binding transcriptional repressor) of toxin-antitoxin stability system